MPGSKVYWAERESAPPGGLRESGPLQVFCFFTSGHSLVPGGFAASSGEIVAMVL
jgi:hypothetical protein